MASLRNTMVARVTATDLGDLGDVGDALLDAARASILDVGWRRSTLTDVARRAGVSRMTIYRRWPDMATLLADLMAREWGTLGEVLPAGPTAAGETSRPTPTGLELIAARVTGCVAVLRSDELFAKIVQVDPELLLPYLLERPGRTQGALLAALEEAVVTGQRDGSVRAGDPVLLSRTVLLAAQGFVLSAGIMTGPPEPREGRSAGPTLAELDGELRRLVERYLAP